MNKIKEILKKIVKTIICVIGIICIVYNICYFLHTTITNKKYFKIFGITLLCADSNSMMPQINKNDLLFVKKTKDELEKGNIITYILNEQIRISKIENVNINDGEISYIVKANNNYYPDSKPVIHEQIVGTVIYNFAGLGFLIKILQSKILTVIIFIVLILLFLYNRYSYLKTIERQRKKNKMKQKIIDKIK